MPSSGMNHSFYYCFTVFMLAFVLVETGTIEKSILKNTFEGPMENFFVKKVTF